MHWQTSLLDRLARAMPGGYLAGDQPASEPTAWGSLALSAAGQLEASRVACDWLVACQARNGSVGVNRSEATPAWPTSLAILAWTQWQNASGTANYQRSIDSAIKWTLKTKGRTTDRKPEIGHDTTLVGWSWAADTHSWLEPTALFVRALNAAGHANHERTEEATRMLVDRLLPTGGANYGNTRVLDQYLLPHVQPSGLVMWALARLPTDDSRIAASLDYLDSAIQQPLGAASLAFAILGLKAHGRQSAHYEQKLETAFAGLSSDASPYKLALLAMATQEGSHS
ncbi:MAG: hypothetical protein AAGF31_01615 [Planctomycetota bacterium]